MAVIAEYNALRVQGGRTKGTKKVNGGHELVLGAYNIFNEQGEFYPFTSQLKAMFEPGSDLNRRVTTNKLHGEQGHPVIQPGQTYVSFLARWRRIHYPNVNCQIKNIRLEWAKDHKGQQYVLVIGVVTGQGPHFASFERMLSDAEHNTCMSGRYILDTSKKDNCISNIVTFDPVIEPGVAIATKYDTPSMECLDKGSFTEELLALSEAEEKKIIVAGEGTHDMVSATMVRSALGWQKTEVLNLGTPLPRGNTTHWL